MPRQLTLGEWVRNHLSEVGEDYGHHMFLQYKNWILQTSRVAHPKLSGYDSFRTRLWMLKKLGLIKATRREKSDVGVDRQYYSLGEDPAKNRDHPGWIDPRVALYGSAKP